MPEVQKVVQDVVRDIGRVMSQNNAYIPLNNHRPHEQDNDDDHDGRPSHDPRAQIHQGFQHGGRWGGGKGHLLGGMIHNDAAAAAAAGDIADGSSSASAEDCEGLDL